MKDQKFEITGMHCENCIESVIKELSQLDLDYYEVEIGMANIRYDEVKTSEKDIRVAIEDAGYQIV